MATQAEAAGILLRPGAGEDFEGATVDFGSPETFGDRLDGERLAPTELSIAEQRGKIARLAALNAMARFMARRSTSARLRLSRARSSLATRR
jgi:hypothetical protein